DRVYHLASPASPVAYREDPIGTLQAGSVGTHTALDLAMRGRARFLLASSSEVYGDPHLSAGLTSTAGIREDYRGNVDPVGPRSMYDEAKRYAEAYVTHAAPPGLETRIARIFNTYGPDQPENDGRLIPSLLRSVRL